MTTVQDVPRNPEDTTRLTSAQLADELGVSRGTVHRWRTLGLITPAWTTAGGHARWDLEVVRRQVAEHLKDGGPATG